MSLLDDSGMQGFIGDTHMSRIQMQEESNASIRFSVPNPETPKFLSGRPVVRPYREK